MSLPNVAVLLYNRINGTAAVTSLLSSSTAIYDTVVPRGATFPVVVFNYQGGGDENKSPHRSLSMLYTIKVIADSYKAADEIDRELDAAFHDAPLTVPSWYNIWLMREEPVRFEETTPEGVIYYHSGAGYRLRIVQ